MKYILEMQIPFPAWESTRDLILRTHFAGKPQLVMHRKMTTAQHAYAAFKCENEFDVRFVIEHLLPDGSKTTLRSLSGHNCSKCGKLFFDSESPRRFRDPFLNKVCWCPECKDAYEAQYDGWRGDFSSARFQGATAPKNPTATGMTGKKRSRRHSLR